MSFEKDNILINLEDNPQIDRHAQTFVWEKTEKHLNFVKPFSNYQK